MIIEESVTVEPVYSGHPPTGQKYYLALLERWLELAGESNVLLLVAAISGLRQTDHNVNEGDWLIQVPL